MKVLTADLDDANLERFMREQRAMGRLSGHPNIVNILQIGATPSGRPFIVMQYHPHSSLDALIRNVVRWTGSRAFALASRLRGRWRPRTGPASCIVM